MKHGTSSAEMGSGGAESAVMASKPSGLVIELDYVYMCVLVMEIMVNYFVILMCTYTDVRMCVI